MTSIGNLIGNPCINDSTEHEIDIFLNWFVSFKLANDCGSGPLTYLGSTNLFRLKK